MLFFEYVVSIQPTTLVTYRSRTNQTQENNMSSNVTQLDLSTFSASAPSICIPRVFPNITKARVEAIFRNLGFGELEQVDMVKKTNSKGEKYQRVFVHFKQWNDDEQTCQARQMLLNDQQVKVVYDDPWFWKIRASQQKPRVVTTRNRRRPAPFIEFEPSQPVYINSLKNSIKDLEKENIALKEAQIESTFWEALLADRD